MQINLTGFLTNNTPAFMSALWNLLLEAQDSPAGVPRTFVEEKKEEMRLFLQVARHIQGPAVRKIGRQKEC